MHFTTDLGDFLRQGRNPDGGWGYRPGKASRLEPTCWAVLALDDRDIGDVLRRWPVDPEGLLLERQNGTPNYAFHGLALLTMRRAGVRHSTGDEALLSAIQKVKGLKLPPSTINTEDTSLQGWSWIADTFSWVEPTAWCLLALKRLKHAGVAVDESRIDIAERLLADRCCKDGGWNYGNSNMLGQQLKPFVPTTAIGLLSLQDRRTMPAVVKSLAYLERDATTERSGSALALATLALENFGRPAGPVKDTLAAQLPTTIELGNHVAGAMALCAMNNERGRAAFGL